MTAGLPPPTSHAAIVNFCPAGLFHPEEFAKLDDPPLRLDAVCGFQRVCMTVFGIWKCFAIDRPAIHQRRQLTAGTLDASHIVHRTYRSSRCQPFLRHNLSKRSLSPLTIKRSRVSAGYWVQNGMSTTTIGDPRFPISLAPLRRCILATCINARPFAAVV